MDANKLHREKEKWELFCLNINLAETKKRDTIHKSLFWSCYADPPHHTQCIMWSLRPQLKSHQICKIQLPLSMVENSQILRPYLLGMTSSTNSIHSNCSFSPIFCLGFYFDRWWLSYPFCMSMQAPHLSITPELETLSWSKLYQTR